MTFFGQETLNRIRLFTDIHEIVFFGKGGYDWNTVYNMPIWLRKYTLKLLKEYYEKQQNNQTQLKDPSEIFKPSVKSLNKKSDYTVKKADNKK